jgi:hypothetical protein
MSNPILTAYFCYNCGVALSPDRGDRVCEACFQELANEAAEALKELADPPAAPGRGEEISN